MDNSTDNPIQILSKRAQAFIDSPIHARDSGAKWEFGLEQKHENALITDKILTLTYSRPSLTLLERLFFESLSRLAIGKNIFFIGDLTFREMENYLRDQNHLPVFDDSSSPQAETVYKEVKNSLLCEIIVNKIKNIKAYKAPPKNWSELSMVERNRWTQSLVALLNTLIPREKPLELALAEAGEISVVLNGFPFASVVLEAVITLLLAITGDKTSLKVVAVQ